MENPGNRLSKKTLFAYGCGDFASNLCWTFVGSYLSVFYTDVVGMAPAIASMIMLIAKIWDGVNDPMFGMIAERTNSKKARFRPYIFYGAPFLALFSVLTFTTFGKGSAGVPCSASDKGRMHGRGGNDLFGYYFRPGKSLRPCHKYCLLPFG